MLTINTRLNGMNLLNATTARWRTTDRRHPQHMCSVLVVGIRKNAVENRLHWENAMVWTGIFYDDIGDVYHRHPHRMGKRKFNFRTNILVATFQNSISIPFDVSIKFTAQLFCKRSFSSSLSLLPAVSPSSTLSLPSQFMSAASALFSLH